ncbi:MAG: hypothetical protein GEU94_14375 [Micromonosporaceae bacterium]|nr:hypothetical protein [Micromonosporaceae bacterium]
MRGRRGPGPWAAPGQSWGRGGGWQQADLPPAEDATGWILGRMPDGWFEAAPVVTVDRDEILVVGRLAPPDVEEGAADSERTGAESGRIARFREETRRQRMEISGQAEHRFRRKVSWGAECGDTRELFTTQSVPVMTRLRQPERQVLDTLVDAGVARSRSDALAWCVRLVNEHADNWLGQLREAMASVDELRRSGPEIQ